MNYWTLLILVPIIWEWVDDKLGESLRDKKLDVFTRTLLMAGVSIGISHFTTASFIGAFALCLATHFLLFDYGINLILPRKPWFAYLGSGWIDNIELWRKLNPWARLLVRVVVFGIGLTTYLI